ncbi:MAG: UDP-N-acetylglucosamine 1-carboxyvinyltransferase [Candidatus Latescibacterota bacterium]|nr:UDP-N-acetylglucosamine 1-carboxyvinyltransferase [Candidatus Latescibacterota bacterium]
MSASSTEEILYIQGARPLRGEVEIQGSKNAALPMIAASLLAEEGETVLHRVPPVKDVLVALEVLRELGAKVDFDAATGTAVIDATQVNSAVIPGELAGRMRASLLFVGALLARFQLARIDEVGGCTIGERNTDYHYRGFVRMGATVEATSSGGYEVATTSLRAADMYCDLPSHTGTENLIMAASLTEGVSSIANAASDPEICDFACLLTKMGAKVRGVGTRMVTISGVPKLHGAEHTVMYDRLDAALMLMAGAITGGEIALKGVRLDHLEICEAKLLQMGAELSRSDDEWVRLKGPEKLSPINVVTTYYPGFPTDLQPGITALACVAHGDSYIRETVFEDRLGHVKNLRAFGATLSPEKDRLVIVHGPARLRGARVQASDIRAGAACVLAGLAAEGRSAVSKLYQLDRGHVRLAERLGELGAGIERL